MLLPSVGQTVPGTTFQGARRPRAAVPPRRDARIALVAGAALAALGAGALLAAPLRGPLALQLGVHLAAGREAAIPLGIGAGLSWSASATAALWLEWTMLLLGFPLIVLAGERLHRWRRVRAAIERAEAFAARRPDAGVLLLGGLTLMPFLPVGALTSLLIGETLRLPPARLVATLMAAELIANLTVALAADSVLAAFPDPALAALVIAGVIIAIGLLVALLPRRAVA